MAKVTRMSRMRVLGTLCIAGGAALVLFVGYLICGTGAQAAEHQRAFARQLAREWHMPAATPRAGPAKTMSAPDNMKLTVGQPFAFIRIPRFGQTWRLAVVEGTGAAQLATGPGHVTGTQLPGQIGNFAVAAHVITAGNPFYHLKTLSAGDTVYVDTKAESYAYRVTSEEIVPATDIGVLYPVPGHPGLRPHVPVITLITCDPAVAWTTSHRAIVFGTLQMVIPR
jgi:sortase A